MRRTTNPQFVSIPIRAGERGLAEYTLNLANYDPENTKLTKRGLRITLRSAQVIISTESKERLDAEYASWLEREAAGGGSGRSRVDIGPAIHKRDFE